MKTIKVWMEYTSKSEIEVEVDDDFDVENYDKLESWPQEWLTDLDASIVENSPTDWGIEE
jgi:hypothetical protein